MADEDCFERASERDATYIPKRPDWKAAKEVSRETLFTFHHAKGVANAEEHMRRMLSSRDLAGCPCLGCTGRFRS